MKDGGMKDGPMKPVLQMESVSLARGNKPVLEDVDLHVDAGQVLALLGPSGSGKSTVVRALLGLTPPQAGTIRLRGELADQDGKTWIAPEDRGLAVVFQDLALWPHLTVAGNLRFVLRARGFPRNEEGERISEMLERVALRGKASSHPGDLSGGEQQRVAIARALVVEPSALLLDEPLSNVDVALKREIIGLLGTLLRDDTAVLYVTHDAREVAHLATQWAVLEQGRVVQQGQIEALRARPATEFVRQMVSEA